MNYTTQKNFWNIIRIRNIVAIVRFFCALQPTISALRLQLQVCSLYFTPQKKQQKSFLGRFFLLVAVSLSSQSFPLSSGRVVKWTPKFLDKKNLKRIRETFPLLKIFSGICKLNKTKMNKRFCSTLYWRTRISRGCFFSWEI